MDKVDIRKFISNDFITISEAMQRINANTYGILFLTDKNHALAACITDGDIRRYLLGGGNVNGLAMDAANHTPRFARDIDDAKLLYHKKNYIVIPIVDRNRQIIDLYNEDLEELKRKIRKSLQVPVVINAGGKGKRLDPLTKILPKPLIPVGEYPIIELIMKEYQSYACSDFRIIVNYKKDLMKAYFHDNDTRYNITWYDEEMPLGTGGGLHLLHGELESTFFFSNCDALLTANYEPMLVFHKEHKNIITMIGAYKNINIPYGVVEMGKGGIIKDMKEKPSISILVNTGIYIVEPEVIDDINEGECIGFPEIIEREKKKGRKVAVYPVSEKDWMDMGQLPELEKMRIRLKDE